MKISSKIKIAPEAIQAELNRWVAGYQKLEHEFLEYRASNRETTKKLETDLKKLRSAYDALLDELQIHPTGDQKLKS